MIAKAVTQTGLYLWKLRTYASVAVILSVSPLLPLFVAVLEPSHALPAHTLLLHASLSSHVVRLLGYLLAVQVDAAVWNHGAGVSGGKLSIHVGVHLQEGVRGGCQADRRLVLQRATSLSVAVLMASLLLVQFCHLQVQWSVIQVRLYGLIQTKGRPIVSKMLLCSRVWFNPVAFCAEIWFIFRTSSASCVSSVIVSMTTVSITQAAFRCENLPPSASIAGICFTLKKTQQIFTLRLHMQTPK